RAVNERVGCLGIFGEGRGHIKARFKAARVANKVADNVRLPLVWLKKNEPPPRLDTDADVDAFLIKVRKIDAQMREEYGVRLGFIRIDTAAACMKIKDNDDYAEINAVCARLKRLAQGFDGVVVVTHHLGKDITRGELGTVAWRANCEMSLFVLANADVMTG